MFDLGLEKLKDNLLERILTHRKIGLEFRKNSSNYKRR